MDASLTTQTQDLTHLPADILKALNDYDENVANGTLPIDNENRAVIAGPTHAEVWMPGNALGYFEATGGIDH